MSDNEEKMQEDAYENNFNEEDEEELSLESISPFDEQLLTHKNIKNNLCGTVNFLEKGHSKVTLHTTNEMTLDTQGLIHSGFIYSAADYAASVAVNEENLIVIGCSRMGFFAPAKVGDIVIFEAKSRFEESKKREVHVIGKINDIKVFEAIFQIVILDDHIFNIQTKNARKKFGKKIPKA